MRRLATLFLLLTLIAAVFGFLGIADQWVGLAKICFFIFLVSFIISAAVNAVMEQSRADKGLKT